MTMREYLITINEDGHVTALEYEEPESVLDGERKEAFRNGYNAALLESRKMVLEFRKHREDSRDANLMYAAVASVHDEVASRFTSYMD